MTTETEAQPKPRAPRGMPGATCVREGEHRTDRGAKLTIREWWNRRRGAGAYRVIQAARARGEVVSEYTARSRGNAAMIFELYLDGIFDLATPLSELPPNGLSQRMGRAWLKAEDGRCGRLHVVGATDCPHVGEDGLITLQNPSVYAGAEEPDSPSRPTPLPQYLGGPR